MGGGGGGGGRWGGGGSYNNWKRKQFLILFRGRADLLSEENSDTWPRHGMSSGLINPPSLLPGPVMTSAVSSSQIFAQGFIRLWLGGGGGGGGVLCPFSSGLMFHLQAVF